MTVGGMDADTERTRMYTQRVMSGGHPLPLVNKSQLIFGFYFGLKLAAVKASKVR